MSKKFFGTDGVRGTVGKDPMTADFALRLASAAAQVLVPKGGTVVIGKDTRLSGYMFESALEAGFVAAGVDVLLTGPLPTPAIAYLTNTMNADFGIVISASHNPYYDNGIKFFDGEGSKLSDETEDAIEARIENPPTTRDSSALGRATILTTARTDYMRFCRDSLPDGMTFDGLKVVIDASHGAAYKVAPRLMSELGADVIADAKGDVARAARHVQVRLSRTGAQPADHLAPFSGEAYGHTGFTGTSIAVDPRRDLVVVLLTNRVYHGREPAAIDRLRLDVHEIFAAATDAGIGPS